MRSGQRRYHRVHIVVQHLVPILYLLYTHCIDRRLRSDAQLRRVPYNTNVARLIVHEEAAMQSAVVRVIRKRQRAPCVEVAGTIVELVTHFSPCNNK